jgi:RNA polymerase sigma-70 factor (ECF subfamily)
MEEDGRGLRITDISGMRASVEELREQIIGLLPRLRRFARTLSRNAHDADDLVQITVERALIRSDQLRPDSSLASWMFGILRNAWIDETRTRVRRDRVFAPEELGRNIADASQGAYTDMLAVQNAMAQLPEEQRFAVALVLVEGLSYKEAAQVLDVPIGTVTSRLARGRDALQTILSELAGAL